MYHLAKKPKLFLYSLLLPSLWTTLGLFLYAVAPEKRLGMFGLVLILMGSLALISWHFTKTYQRAFHTIEKIKLILYIALWTMLFEFGGIWYYLNFEASTNLGNVFYETIAITAVVDLLLISAGVLFTAKKMNRYFLARIENQSTS